MLKFAERDCVAVRVECPGVKPGDTLQVRQGDLHGNTFHVSIFATGNNPDDETCIAVLDETSGSDFTIPETFGLRDSLDADLEQHPVRSIAFYLATSGPVEVGVSVDPV